MPRTSEFGGGFIYSLVLFAKHYERAERIRRDYESLRQKTKGKDLVSKKVFSEENAYSLWFNGAADHLFDFAVPPAWLGKPIGKLAARLKKQALLFRLTPCTENEFLAFWSDVEKLCLLADKALGLTPSKADWN